MLKFKHPSNILWKLELLIEKTEKSMKIIVSTSGISPSEVAFRCTGFLSMQMERYMLPVKWQQKSLVIIMKNITLKNYVALRLE